MACGTPVAGQPRAGTTKPPEPTLTTSKPPNYSLARLCELISAEEAQALGGSAEGEEGNSVADGHDICSWADETSLVLGFQEGVTTAQVDTGPHITNTPITVNGLPAVQSLSTDSIVTCEILVDLPSGRLFASSVAVLSRGEGKYDPCDVATSLANLVVPRVADQ